MNKTIQLVNIWGEFEKRHPEASIEDFCRFHLIQQREKESKGTLVGGVVPSHADGLLLKIMGRISKMHMVYTYAALEDTELDQLEEFGMLSAIHQMDKPNKKEVISSMLLELSSGTDILRRMMERQLVTETPDQVDKRAKILSLTKKGEKALQKARRRIRQLAFMLLHDMEEDEKLLCIKLLKGVEAKFSGLFPGQKGKKFNDIFIEAVGKRIEHYKSL